MYVIDMKYVLNKVIYNGLIDNQRWIRIVLTPWRNHLLYNRIHEAVVELVKSSYSVNWLKL